MRRATLAASTSSQVTVWIAWSAKSFSRRVWAVFSRSRRRACASKRACSARVRSASNTARFARLSKPSTQFERSLICRSAFFSWRVAECLI